MSAVAYQKVPADKAVPQADSAQTSFPVPTSKELETLRKLFSAG